MRYEDALRAVREALDICRVTPGDGEYAVYFSFTLKVITLHRRSFDGYVPVAGDNIVANERSLRKDGRPKNDFWIIGFSNFYEAFTFFIVLWNILRCRYGYFFGMAVDDSAKPHPFFPL